MARSETASNPCSASHFSDIKQPISGIGRRFISDVGILEQISTNGRLKQTFYLFRLRHSYHLICIG